MSMSSASSSPSTVSARTRYFFAAVRAAAVTMSAQALIAMPRNCGAREKYVDEMFPQPTMPTPSVRSIRCSRRSEGPCRCDRPPSEPPEVGRIVVLHDVVARSRSGDERRHQARPVDRAIADVGPAILGDRLPGPGDVLDVHRDDAP